MSSTLEALRRTSKGSINYEHSLQWEHADQRGKLQLLHQWTSPPPISAEAVDYITKRTKRLSLDSPKHINKQPQSPLIISINEDVHHTTPTTKTTPTSSTHGSDIVAHSQGVTALNDTATGVEQSESVIGQFSRELLMQEQSMDDLMMEEVANEVQDRIQWFSSSLEQLRRSAEEQRQREIERREREAKLKREKEEALEIQRQIKIKQTLEAFAKKLKIHEQKMESNLRSGEEERREMNREMSERKEMERQRQMRRCSEQKELTSRRLNELVAILKSCRYPKLLSQPILGDFERTLSVLRSIEREFITMEQSKDPDSNQIDKLQASLSGLLPKVVDLKATIDEVNLRGEMDARKNEELLRQTAEKLEEERKAKEEGERKREQEKAAAAEKDKPATTADATKTADSAAPTKPSSQDGGKGKEDKATDLGMPTSMLVVYSDLQDKLSKAATVTESMTSSSDPALKKYRFDLQKAITMTVNSISANSGEDLRGKISRLQRLIRGDSIEVMGKSLSVRNHPAAKMYCCNLLAKKLVKQGEDQVASNHDAAFPISAVAVGVWNEFPDIGDLILAHFYSTCPVLVPFYMPRSKDMSEVDYMKLQGYKVTSKGSVESEDMFLGRMRGIIRLYAAILQTPPLPFGPQRPNCHGLEYGWAWLARVLNMEPHPTLTATAIGDLLETAGHALLRKYNKQFKKLLFVLCKEYVPKIEKVTPADQRGPLSRLKQFLEDCISSGRISAPKGCLDNRFWQTRSQGIAVA